MRITIMTILLIPVFILAGCGGKDSATEDKPRETLSKDAPAGLVDLHVAAGTGDLEAIRKHIEMGSDLNVRDKEGGACPLSTAALYGQAEAAKALIEGGADIDCRGNDGATPLHVAAFFCRPEIVKALVDAGADQTIKNSYGSTPRATVTGPFEKVKPIYEHFSKSLGIEMDLAEIERMRPKIAEMLQ
jgi:ankyrin repeat protein